MKYMTSSEIRSMWLEFFKEKGHQIEPSSSLIPDNDPTLLWINAGVAPLKKYFDGREKPRNPRITNAQKCIRTNDIENVGKTARHHTFFEMLGNFSIGDYFKEEAIEFGFELLTSPRWFAIPLEKLYFTLYVDDDTAYKKWMSLGVPESHLIRLESNFWEIGQGPCGPDTEIFYDRGEKYDKRGKELIENDIENDRFIEIWNIVFSQYNSTPGLKRNEYPELPSKNIDTGCGLERVACVMQGVDTNYDTDLFMPVIREVEKISGVPYNGDMAFKVIADHIRTVTFAISDGAVLSNEGRGYVLRRVLRRATKYGKKLGIDHPFLYNLVDLVVENMRGFYTYLDEKKEIVKTIVKKEEEKFLETLASGEKKLDEILKQTKNNIVSGIDAFTLFDTYGFPVELTVESCEERGYQVDIDGFKEEMEKQKKRARDARCNKNSMNTQNEDFLNFKEESKFIGYSDMESVSKVIAVFGNSVVLDKTPFYATSGGQVFDEGTIEKVKVIDVSKMPNGQFIHYLEENPFKVGDIVHAVINKENRIKIANNHSAAHLVHKSLKLVLGSHVHQQGSQITPQEMRFDFNNYNSLTDDEILRVENLVNKAIKDALPVITKELPIEEAKKTGAEALFGEKYGDVVRVVDMGYSVEFCGGTHAKNTSDLKKFAILNVESIGSGIFRISGVTGPNAMDLVKSHALYLDNEINQIKDKAKSILSNAKEEKIDLSFDAIPKDDEAFGYQYLLNKKEELAKYKEAIKNLEKEYKRLKAKKALESLDSYDKFICGNTLVGKVMDVPVDVLKQIVDALLNKLTSGVVFLASVLDGKIIFVCKNNIGLNAGKLVKEAAIITGGNGGGKPDMAQAGGKDIARLDEALQKVKELLK